MNRRIWENLNLAGKIATSKDNGRAFLLGALGIRKDGVMVCAANSTSQEPDRRAHAEWRISSKIDYGATIYVARIRLLNGEFAMAKPCFSCEKVLKSKRVKRIYYTISNTEYGVLDI